MYQIAFKINFLEFFKLEYNKIQVDYKFTCLEKLK